MAERQQVVRWIRQLLSTVAVAALTAGVVSGENTGGTGACATDYCEATPNRLESYSPAEVALRVPTGGQVQAAITGVEITTASAGDDITLTSIDDILLAPADDLTALVTGDAIINAANFSSTVTSIFAAQTTGGGSISTTTGGVNISAGSAGDDVSISAIDVATMASGTNYARTDTDSVDLFAGTAGSDIYIAANDLLTMDAAAGGIQATIVSGGTSYPLPRTLQTNYINASPVGTSEAVAATLVLPANALIATGNGVHVIVTGQVANNVNDKNLRFRIGASGSGTGGTLIGLCDLDTPTEVANFVFEAWIYRTGANTQRGDWRCEARGATLATSTGHAGTSTAAITDTAIMNIVYTTNPAGAAADITTHLVRWEWL